jgi:hypothetical protein
MVCAECYLHAQILLRHVAIKEKGRRKAAPVFVGLLLLHRNRQRLLSSARSGAIQRIEGDVPYSLDAQSEVHVNMVS